MPGTGALTCLIWSASEGPRAAPQVGRPLVAALPGRMPAALSLAACSNIFKRAARDMNCRSYALCRSRSRACRARQALVPGAHSSASPGPDWVACGQCAQNPTRAGEPEQQCETGPLPVRLRSRARCCSRPRWALAGNGDVEFEARHLEMQNLVFCFFRTFF